MIFVLEFVTTLQWNTAIEKMCAGASASQALHTVYIPLSATGLSAQKHTSVERVFATLVSSFHRPARSMTLMSN